MLMFYNPKRNGFLVSFFHRVNKQRLIGVESEGTKRVNLSGRGKQNKATWWTTTGL